MIKGVTDMTSMKVCSRCGEWEFTSEKLCSKCSSELIDSGFSEVYWNKLSQEKKDQYTLQFCGFIPKEGVDMFEEIEREKTEKAAALQKMLISSGFNFDGYKIVKYSGYISGDDACEIPRGGIFGQNNGQNLTDALVKIRRQALKELKEAAYDLGCNAVIGVDFDYITLEPETVNITGGTRYEPYIICVTANGNAVVVEKE